MLVHKLHREYNDNSLGDQFDYLVKGTWVLHTLTHRAMIDFKFQQSWSWQHPQLLGLDGAAPPFQPHVDQSNLDELQGKSHAPLSWTPSISVGSFAWPYIVFCFYYLYCREGNSNCARHTIAKFNVGTSWRLLRCQSTCHSSFNGHPCRLWMQRGANSLLILTSVHFNGCDRAKIKHCICFMSTFNGVELCKGTMSFHSNYWWRQSAQLIAIGSQPTNYCD